jgi:hypothetical protein
MAQYLLNRKMGGSQSQPGHDGEEGKSLPPPGIELSCFLGMKDVLLLQ